VPAPGASIFDNLPSHPRRTQARQPKSKSPWGRWTFGGEHDDEYEYGNRNRQSSAAAQAAAQAAAASNSRVIDCGAERGRAHDINTGTGEEGGGGGYVARLSERQVRAAARNNEGVSPPPRAEYGIGAGKAVRDWRFGRVRVESFDLDLDFGTEEGRAIGGEGVTTGTMAGKLEGGNGSGAAATPAASLGPNLGGMGLATKARYAPLETKNTEAGWGIVHLYREGDEPSTFSGNAEVQDGSGEGNSKSQDGAGRTEEEEGTILCIPAVPSYMSPSDFLGFIGEKWRGYVSHYRMVMTSRMSRYMVLMKFRDAGKAREWRKEFNGKPFDSVEVSDS
jgi:BRCA1-associated protein